MAFISSPGKKIFVWFQTNSFCLIWEDNNKTNLQLNKFVVSAVLRIVRWQGQFSTLQLRCCKGCLTKPCTSGSLKVVINFTISNDYLIFGFAIPILDNFSKRYLQKTMTIHIPPVSYIVLAIKIGAFVLSVDNLSNTLFKGVCRE